jgi:hypothetical protein
MKNRIPYIVYRIQQKIRTYFSGIQNTEYKIRRVRSRGFTLLMAALVSSIVLALGASIFTLAKKEVMLSSLGRDSQFAFYSADQAAECALYWDARWSYFGTSTPTAYLPPNDPVCDGQHWTPPGGTRTGGEPGTYPYSVTFQYAPSSAGVSYCADVVVYKCDGVITTNSSGNFVCTPSVPPVIHTTIHADGFNTSCGSLTTNPRALQRSVELHY